MQFILIGLPYWDEETGLHYNFHRFYDPASGRYVESDPLGFQAGDVNLFRYAQNQVLNNGDPWGLERFTLLPPASDNSGTNSSGLLFPNTGKSISTLSFPKYKCNEYDKDCFLNCLKDVGINKAIDILTFGFNPTELDVYRDKKGLEFSATGTAGAVLKGAERFTASDRSRIQAQFDRLEELANRPRNGRDLTTMKFQKRKKVIEKTLLKLKFIPAAGLVYEGTKSGVDVWDCFQRCIR